MSSPTSVDGDYAFMCGEDLRTTADLKISPTEAKSHFFLNAKDLQFTAYESFSMGFGTGRPCKYYNYDDCREVAIEKHGLEGLRKKWSARKKREAKKQAAIEKAKEAEKELAAATKENTPFVMEESKEIKQLRKSLLKMAKKKLNFEMSGAPGNWRVEVPLMQKSVYATLIGKPNDPELRSLVKGGAYYSESVNAEEFFGSNDLVKYFSREGVGQRIGDHVIVKYKPSTSEMSFSGYAEITL